MRKIIRELLRERQYLYGCFIQIPSPELVEMARDYDYIIIDYEHGHISHEQMLSMVRAADAVDLAVMVRIPDLNANMINKILDMGVSGLIASNISTVVDAQKLVSLTHYEPIGSRGACPFTRANYYGFGSNRNTYYEKMNQDIFILATIEDTTGVENMTEILNTDGIDGIGTGQFDLSVSFGIPGQINHPKVQEVVKMAEEAARQANKIYTVMLMDPSEATDFPGDVCRLMMCGAPELHIQQYLKDTVAQLRKTLEL